MRFRLGLIIGFVAGYLLGARAGRQRYEQIRRAWLKLLEAEPVEQLTEKVMEVADLGARRVATVAGDGLTAASERLREAREADRRDEGNGDTGRGSHLTGL